MTTYQTFEIKSVTWTLSYTLLNYENMHVNMLFCHYTDFCVFLTHREIIGKKIVGTETDKICLFCIWIIYSYFFLSWYIFYYFNTENRFLNCIFKFFIIHWEPKNHFYTCVSYWKTCSHTFIDTKKLYYPSYNEKRVKILCT